MLSLQAIKRNLKEIIKKTVVFSKWKNYELRKKQLLIQKNGLSVLNKAQTILADIDVVCFADFGTCLGLVREKALLKHDLDIDIGVVANSQNKKIIRNTLEKQGFKLSRLYVYQENIVEESYLYRNVRVDFNYYEVNNEYARTWLFYAKPGYQYDNKGDLHVVQMTYSPILGVKHEQFSGFTIALPENPELLMEEKYGPNWRIPDTGWIYWQSPAAEPLEEIVHFESLCKK